MNAPFSESLWRHQNPYSQYKQFQSLTTESEFRLNLTAVKNRMTVLDNALKRVYEINDGFIKMLMKDPETHEDYFKPKLKG